MMYCLTAKLHRQIHMSAILVADRQVSLCAIITLVSVTTFSLSVLAVEIEGDQLPEAF